MAVRYNMPVKPDYLWAGYHTRTWAVTGGGAEGVGGERVDWEDKTSLTWGSEGMSRPGITITRS